MEIIWLFHVMWRVFAVIAAIISIIFIHELGHYLVGRWCGIGAKVFSIGFGPQLCAYRDKRGTLWRLALIPLGGYVKFEGDENIFSQPEPSARAIKGGFYQAHALKRALTVLAGPLFNILFAVVVLAILFFHQNRVVLPVVGGVLDGMPAQEAGLKVGDIIRAVDGHRVDSFQDLTKFISVNGGVSVPVVLEREERLLDADITPKITRRSDGFGGFVHIGTIGVYMPEDPQSPGHLDPAYIVNQPLSVWAAIDKSLDQTTFIGVQTVKTILGLITARQDRCQLSGPTKTVRIAWQISEFGFTSILKLVALLSIGIGLINLFPLPPLDGGHLVFYLIEAMTGKPVPAAIQESVFRVGMILVLAFMVFAVMNDYFPC